MPGGFPLGQVLQSAAVQGKDTTSMAGEAGQLKHLCSRIKQDRAMLLRQRAEIDTMLREMEVIEAQCHTTLAQLETA